MIDTRARPFLSRPPRRFQNQPQLVHSSQSCSQLTLSLFSLSQPQPFHCSPSHSTPILCPRSLSHPHPVLLHHKFRKLSSLNPPSLSLTPQPMPAPLARKARSLSRFLFLTHPSVDDLPLLLLLSPICLASWRNTKSTLTYSARTGQTPFLTIVPTTSRSTWKMVPSHPLAECTLCCRLRSRCSTNSSMRTSALDSSAPQRQVTVRLSSSLRRKTARSACASTSAA